jgi:hypothetical protein
MTAKPGYQKFRQPGYAMNDPQLLSRETTLYRNDLACCVEMRNRDEWFS